MKIKRFLQACLVAALGLGLPLAINSSVAFASGNNCLWNGSSSANFSTAANWTNCGGTTPGDGDNLIFDNTSIPGSGAVLNDDLTTSPSPTFATITFQGSGGTGYTLDITSGGTLLLTGGITDTTSQYIGGAIIDAPIQLVASNVAFSVANHLTLTPGGSDTFSTNFQTATFSGGGTISSALQFSGGGVLNFNMGSGTFNLVAASPSYTGPVNVNSGQLSLSSSSSPYPDMLSGASLVTVASGATLSFDDSSASAGTIAEPFNIAGDGSSSCTVNSVACGALFNDVDTGSGNSNLTFAGAITLANNTEVASASSTDNIVLSSSSSLSGNFTIESMLGGLIIDSSSNTSKSVNGTYVAGSTTPVGSGAVGATAGAPKTPDTGLALLTTHPLETLAISTVAAFTILVVAHRLKTVKY